eukprot:1143150_1
MILGDATPSTHHNDYPYYLPLVLRGYKVQIQSRSIKYLRVYCVFFDSGCQCVWNARNTMIKCRFLTSNAYRRYELKNKLFLSNHMLHALSGVSMQLIRAICAHTLAYKIQFLSRFTVHDCFFGRM